MLVAAAAGWNNLAVRWLLIIALLLFPACLTPRACAAAMPTMPKKMTGDCCRNGCDCSAGTQTPAKQTPPVLPAPDLAQFAAALLAFAFVTIDVPLGLRFAVSALNAPALAHARIQSLLCLWTT